MNSWGLTNSKGKPYGDEGYIWIDYDLLSKVIGLSAFTLEPVEKKPCPNTVKDAVGREYKTTEICGQCWMAENLRTYEFNNKEDIFQVVTGQWKNSKSPGYTFHTDTPFTYGGYGLFYNKYAAFNTAGVCPEGWHVPTQNEWKLLFDNCYKNNVGDLMDVSDDWRPSSINRTNASGFSALPGGLYCFGETINTDPEGFYFPHSYAAFWSSTGNHIALIDKDNPDGLFLNGTGDFVGLPCRCIKD